MQFVAGFQETPECITRTGRIRSLELPNLLRTGNIRVNAKPERNQKEASITVQSSHPVKSSFLSSQKTAES
jgi:hypothetical protein